MTSMIYPTTNPLAIEQLVLERGEGVYVFDSNGKRYLEGLAGLWCTSLGSGLIQRPDDTKEKVSVRLNVYNDVTKPILDFYKEQEKFFAVDGNGSSEDVYKRLLETVSKISQ